MSTPQNDGDPVPRPDANENDTNEGSDVKENSEAKEDSDTKKGSDAEEASNAEEGSDTKEGPKRKSPEDQLNDLKKKREKLNDRIDRLSSAKRARDRKKDTRRKIIIGGIMQRVAEKNRKFREWLHKEIEKHVKTDRDRELFADILKNKG